MDESRRPWGHYEVLAKGSGYQVKRIQVDAGKRFSLQKHNQRAEKWLIVSGKGVATVGEREVPVEAGQLVEIEKGQVHRLTNPGAEPLIFVEVQFGSYLGEDDIVRLEDDFGRD